MFNTIKEHVTENALGYILGATATLSGVAIGSTWLQNRRARHNAQAIIQASAKKTAPTPTPTPKPEMVKEVYKDHDYSPMHLGQDPKEAMQGLELMKDDDTMKYSDETETDYRQTALIFFYIIINRPWIYCSKLTKRQRRVIQNLAREYVEFVEPLESYSKKEYERAINEVTRRISVFVAQNNRNANSV